MLKPGDGVLLLEPYYGYHLNSILLSGTEPQFLTLAPPEFALDEAELHAAIRPHTRAIVMCTPSNPSGRMFTEAELRMLDRVAREHDLLVITDEIYEYLTYDGRRHVSPATVATLGERTVTSAERVVLYGTDVHGWDRLVGPSVDGIRPACGRYRVAIELSLGAALR